MARMTLDVLLKLLAEDVRSAFLAAMQDVIGQAVLVEIMQAIEAGDAQRAFELLGFNPATLRPLVMAVEQAYERAGAWTADGYPRTPGYAYFRFDVRSPQAERWAREKSSELVTRLTEETRLNVKSVIESGLARGSNPRQTALEIVGRINQQTGQREGGIIGLTEQQTMWSNSVSVKLSQLNQSYFDMVLRDKRFDKTVQKAIDTGKPLSREVIQKLVDRYRANALRYRGTTIARTESIQAFNASEMESARQVVATGRIEGRWVRREWDSAGDGRVRPEHKALDGQQVGIDEPFVALSGARLMFPGDSSLGAPASLVIGCRCIARTVIDWIGAQAERERRNG